jgi:integrase
VWQGRLPSRVDRHRRPIPGTFDTAVECRRALNECISDIDRGRKRKPPGRPGAATRRLETVIAEYIVDRRNDGLDPIAVNTVRDYKEVLKNVITHPDANLGRMPIVRLDSPALDSWLQDIRAAGVSHRRASKAYAVIRAALAWEVRKGRLAVNPAREVRRASTKEGRSRRLTADPVLLPSWGEVAILASHPPRLEDRLLVLTIAWAGLRWSEAVGLSVSDVWPDRPKLSVRRIYVWNGDGRQWELEEVKGGNAATVPLPTPLWKALLELADTRHIDDRPGGDLLFRPTRHGHGMKPTMTIDHTDWSKRVWYPARIAAGLTGDPSLPELDPRRRALHIKDLRAYAASVVVDSGGTQYEAAALLRHSDVLTTNRYYARAQDEKSHDHARARIRIDMDLTLPQRIDALWNAWCQTHPEQTTGLLTTST